MIVFQVVFCVLAMVGLVTAFNWAGRCVEAARTVRRIRERAACDEAIREVIIQHELAIWDSVPPELLPDLITHTPEDFDD